VIVEHAPLFVSVGNGRRSGKRGAEEVDTHLVQLARCRATNENVTSTCARRIHGPFDLAFRVVKRFTKVVPSCGPFLRCHRRETVLADSSNAARSTSFHIVLPFEKMKNPGKRRGECNTFQPLVSYATIIPWRLCMKFHFPSSSADLLPVSTCQTANLRQALRVEYYYKTKWGSADEFLQLLRRTLSTSEERSGNGTHAEVWMDQPLPHDRRWPLGLSRHIVFKNSSVANEPFDEDAIRSSLPDQRPTKGRTAQFEYCSRIGICRSGRGSGREVGAGFGIAAAVALMPHLYELSSCGAISRDLCVLKKS